MPVAELVQARALEQMQLDVQMHVLRTSHVLYQLLHDLPLEPIR